MGRGPSRGTGGRLSGEERRELIRQAAMEVFAERGYQEASMGAIARAAGITPAVIYDHFPSKAELQIELLDRQAQELLTFVAEAVAAAPEQPDLRLRVGVDAFFAFVEQHSFAWRMIFRDPPTDPPVAAAYARLGARATDGIALLIKADAPPAIRDAPDFERRAEMFAQLLKTAQNGLAYWWYDHREVPREEIVERVLEFCWLGLERVGEGERMGPVR